MKRSKRFLALMLSAVLVFGLTACGDTAETTTTDTTTDTTTESTDTTTDDTATTETEKPVLRVGMEGDYAPFDWLQSDDSNGALITDNGTYMNGYDIMMAQKIADALGYELEIHQIAWDGLIASVQSDKIDCVIAGMSITEERALSVDFTDAYYVADLVIVTQADSDCASATSLEDLAGHSISANINTIWYDVLSQVEDYMEVLPALDNATASITAVSSGKVDCIVMDTPSAMSVLMSHPELAMVTFEDGNGFDITDADKLIGIAVQKGNTELLDAINGVLATITEEERQEMIQEALTIQPLNEE